MADTTTTRPTHSFPTVSLAREGRIVARTQDGLVCLPVWDGILDWARLTPVADGCDAMIYPSWSDGSEHPIALKIGDSVHFAPLPDEGMGLQATITRSADNTTVTISMAGYFRVTPA